MSESDFYKILFEENIFSPLSYDLGSIPNKITFGEFVFEFKKADEPFGDSYAIVSYYQEGVNIPRELINSLKKKYITTECGIYSKENSKNKNGVNELSSVLYISRRVGLQVFISEMKGYFCRVYNCSNTRTKTKK